MILRHEGYIAEVGYEDGDALMHGVVTNARGVLHFAGRNIEELKAAFADTIADYREWCKERGIDPERPYSGTLSLRITPELHRMVAEQAARAGESLNQFIADRLEEKGERKHKPARRQPPRSGSVTRRSGRTRRAG